MKYDHLKQRTGELAKDYIDRLDADLRKEAELGGVHESMRGVEPRELFNFRDFKKVYMVTVLEGDGTTEDPYREERYIFDDDRDQYLGVIRDQSKFPQP